MMDFFKNEDKTIRLGFTLSFGGLFIFALLNIAITYYHSGNFGVLSGVIPDDNWIVSWALFLIYPLVIDVPVLITGTVLITVGFLGLSDKLKKRARWANVGFMVLSCVGNYISVYSSNGNYIHALSGTISPFNLWVLSELLFLFVAEFVSKTKTSQSINELKAKKAELEKSVNELSSIQNSMSASKDELNKFNEYARKHKEELNKYVTELEEKISKREGHLKTLDAELQILRQEKTNIKSWFLNMSSSDTANKSQRVNTKKRRTDILKVLSKEHGYSDASLRQDVKVIESKINSNGTF
jgi:hypothetical protein